MINQVLVFGAGYVGCSIGILLAQNSKVIMIDTDQEKVSKINNKKSPIDENHVQDLLNKKNLQISASTSAINYIDTTDLVILALPTNYDDKNNSFDTSILESVLAELEELCLRAPIVIKSTVYVGFTEKVKNLFPSLNIVFVPEFLREGNAIEDNINPTRIVIGDEQENTSHIADIFLSISENSPKVFYMGSSEAEAVKLFANTYLAMRVSFFNELDSYSLAKGFNTKQIIDGVTSDIRIGNFYHNPSFGYGGYCLPKDTKQLLSNFNSIPQNIFSAVVESNKTRKDFLLKNILELNPEVVGIYRLIMKKGSTNFRESAIYDIMEALKNKGLKIYVYEPIQHNHIDGLVFINDIAEFKKKSDIILANRVDDKISDVSEKIFTRDIYGEN